MLLSELDEIGVINYILIPFLSEFIVESDSIDSKYSSIDKYLQLRSIYSSFYSILKENNVNEINEHFNRKLSEFRPRHKREEISTVEFDDDHSSALDKLSEKEIKPFLIEYKPKILQKIIELKDFVENQSKSDSDIISLI